MGFLDWLLSRTPAEAGDGDGDGDGDDISNALANRLVGNNAHTLRHLYGWQSRVADECRRANIPCAAAIIAETRARAQPDHASLVSQACLRLREALVRVHSPGWCVGFEARGGSTTPVEHLRDMIELARSPEASADTAAHVAELDRAAAAEYRKSPSNAPGFRALAAHEARELRRPRGRLERLEECIVNALAVVTVTPADDAVELDVAALERRMFDMGYVERLWRGIEHLLPEGVAETRGRMPPTFYLGDAGG